MRTLVLLCLALAACGPRQETPAPPAAQAGAPARTALAIVATPQPNARVFSPMVVTGLAPGDWYFEAQFHAQIVGADNKVIAEGPAMASTDWTAEGPKTFHAELAFKVAADTPATLIVQEDMTEEGATPREVRVPVVLTAE